MTSSSITDIAQTIPLRAASPQDLEKLSKEGMLSLSLKEMQTIQSYFNTLGRDPMDVELEALAQTWSEHCVHKTFKARFSYVEEVLGDTKSLTTEEKKYENLLKETIVKATEQLQQPWCLSVFKDNAGVIEFDQEDGVSFKVETHNHPSALEPYGGAGTGLGGVIRDILGCGLGGKPIMNSDVFCFGPLDTKQETLPEGALHPKKIARGVVAGVRDYGNRMGIPTGNGAIYFDPGYVGNPLVFCGTVGIQPKTTIQKSVNPGDLVVAMGGRTGRDGIHGATFSSAPLEDGITSSVVQVGHAIMEKKFMDVLLIARQKNLYRSVTDCGAGGFSSAVGELGQETGVHVSLEKAPLKYPGLKPWEIWVSESQERMVLAVPPENWNSLNTLCKSEDVEAVVIGEFTNDKKLKLTYNNQVVCDINMEFLHDGVPKLEISTKWNADEFQKKFKSTSTIQADKNSIDNTLKTLLAHPIIASKEAVIRQYDHEVQGGSIIKPLMGTKHDGPSDACVFRPKLTSWRGVGISNGLNPELGKIDPYLMAKVAVDEAYRNLISVGGGLSTVAILDNFCWGDAKSTLELAGLVRAAEGCKEASINYQLPFISGKDSFNNTWKSTDGTLQSIPPTLLISAIGIIEDIKRCLTSGLKDENTLLYVIGETKNTFKGTLTGSIWNFNAGELPDVNFAESKALYKKLQQTMKHNCILACHDVSEGGIAVTLAEMGFGGDVGISLDLPSTIPNAAFHLFSETPGRFVVEVPQIKQSDFEQTIGLKFAQLIGKTTKKPSFEIKHEGKIIFDESIATLKAIWKSSLKSI